MYLTGRLREIKHFEKLTFRNLFKKIIGITPDYTFGDKCIAYGTFLWSFVITFGFFYLGTIIWNSFSTWPVSWWGWRLFIISVVIGCVVALISMVWFMIGGIIDMRRRFHDLAARRNPVNALDNGMVDGNVSLADRAELKAADEIPSEKQREKE